MKWPIRPQETLIRLDARGIVQCGPDQATTKSADEREYYERECVNQTETARGLRCLFRTDAAGFP